MIRAAILAAALAWGGPALAQDPENVLVIDVAGEAEGTIEIELLPDLAPIHVERIKELARAGAYDGVAFHRVIGDFMAQTGDVEFGKREGYDPAQAGLGGSDLPDLEAEFSETPFVAGVVGMARSADPDSANSQFFIMTAPAPHLDGQYTAVGRVIEGQEVVEAIRQGDPAANGAVEDPDSMERVRIKSDL
jgi:peptidylprolyl isomerase